MELTPKNHIFSEIMIEILGNYELQDLHYFAVIATSLIIREVSEKEKKMVPTAGIAVPKKRGEAVLLIYNTDFTDTLNEKQLKFLFFHEIFHVILLTNERAHLHNHDPMLVNITHDMVINSTLLEHYPDMIEAPSKGMPIIPSDYTGLRNYESIILELGRQVQKKGGIKEYLEDQGFKSIEGVGKDGKGNFTGETLDIHVDMDKLTPDQAEALDKLRPSVTRGLQESNMKETLEKFVPKPTINVVDYISKYSKAMKGDIRKATWHKRNRKMPEFIKGAKKRATYFNLVLDTSGSMGHDDMIGLLGAVMRNNIFFKLIQIDTKVQDIVLIKSHHQLTRYVKEFKGRGGTVLQPALDYCKDNDLEEPCVVLTDGYTDELTFHTRGLVVYTGCESPISGNSAKVTQIKFEPK